MIRSTTDSRRNFIKTAVAGAAGFMVTGVSGQSQSSKEISASAWTPNKKINPNIDNLRVVCCHDPSMISGAPASWNMEGQNAPVNVDRVFADLDAMAKTLSLKNSAEEAWKTIFRKPTHKNWKDVKAAIKVNCISENHPRVAVVAKICTELNRLGIPNPNIIIYDSDDDAHKHYFTFKGKGLPEDVIVSKLSQSLGGMVETNIPEPYPGSFKCTKALATGDIDILVNIAVNKGHNADLGKTTLTLKNHAGTFEPKPIHTGGGLNYIIAFNKSNAILGGSPVRQQLCIVDSIWAMTGGPFGKPNKQLCRLLMGTFSPAVDYLTAKRIREPLMKVTHKNIDRFLIDFGYIDFSALDLVNVEIPA